MYSLQEFFRDVHDLAVWDIAINHDHLNRHHWPDSLIVDHALYLYLFQQQRIRTNMKRDSRLPDIDLRDFSLYAVDHRQTYWRNPSFGYMTVSFSDLDAEPRFALYPQTTL